MFSNFSGSEKSHIVLFYNPITRKALKNLIQLIGQFKETLSNLTRQNPSDSTFYELNKSLQFAFDKWPLNLKSLESFINESFEIIEKAMKGTFAIIITITITTVSLSLLLIGNLI